MPRPSGFGAVRARDSSRRARGATEETRLSDPGFSDAVALVTGAGKGIGRAVARALATRGARVAAADVDGDAARAVAGELAGAARAYQLDVTDAAAVESTVGDIERDLGPVGVLVNVAGILRPGRLLDCPDEDWAATFAVNTTGVFHTSRAVARGMAARGDGSIVTVASNAANVPRAGMGAYAASKAASAMLTKCFGLELADVGVRCNVVAPGSTDTDMGRASWASSSLEAVVAGSPEAFRLGIPLGRVAAPEDIADAVLFLASAQARHITMHELRVDGGATLGA